MSSEVTEYQHTIKDSMNRFFGEQIPVETEWQTITDIGGLYSPRIDIAVGPFSVIRDVNKIVEYNQLMDTHEAFISKLIEYNNTNIRTYRDPDERIDLYHIEPTIDSLKHVNRNGRCWLAIEIENKVSRKHLLGGVVNACALGRIGICIGWTEDKVKAFVKLQMYWEYLNSVGKNTFGTKNLIILNKNQLIQAIITENSLDLI